MEKNVFIFLYNEAIRIGYISFFIKFKSEKNCYIFHFFKFIKNEIYPILIASIIIFCQINFF